MRCVDNCTVMNSANKNFKRAYCTVHQNDNGVQPTLITDRPVPAGEGVLASACTIRLVDADKQSQD